MTARTAAAPAWLALGALVVLTCGAPARAQGMPGMGQEPDFTNLGVTGARGEVSGAAVVVREVSPGTPAAAGGLQPGDEVVGAGGKALQAGSPDPIAQLWAEIDRVEQSKKRVPLALRVRRGGKELDVELRLAQLGPCSKTCPTKCKRCDQVVKAGLAYLARSQAPNGSFPTTLGGKTGLVVVTSLGGLAFLAAGASPQPGSPLGRAADYVLSHANVAEKGGLSLGAQWNQENWEHAYALIFLSEVARRTKRRDVDAKLSELGKKLLETQEASGGWGHGPGGPNALGYVELEIVSNYALLGLGCARRQGVELDAAKLEKALTWVVGTSNGDGGVGYSHRQGQQGFGDPGRTAGALVAFQALGQRSHPFFAKMASFTLARLGKLTEGHVSPAMHLVAGAMATHLLGKQEWRQYLDAYRLRIQGARRPDGSFAATPTHESQSLRNNTDRTVGPCWTTASYVLILCLDRDKLSFLDGKDAGGSGSKGRVRTGG
ncbi:MAG: DUF6288 domain-containing protein [Planctomycetota bacterium]